MDKLESPAKRTDSVAASGSGETTFRPETDVDTCRVLGRLLDSDTGEYYFETDHLALKNNDDYRSLLRTVAVLQAQRAKAVQDLDSLLSLQMEALEQPIAFVEKLQRREDLNLPAQQKVADLPHVEWEKYSRSVDPDCFAHRHMTRHKRPAVVRSTSDGGGGGEEGEPGDSAVIRGRVCNIGKPQTFNQLWTVEEQKRLEDLLLKYPPEEVEARRWEKIAKGLGNRTPQQVASRIQKYFIKLTKAGLPVPGRIPNLNYHNRRLGAMRHHRHNRFLFQQSTFLASHDPPVFMSDYDEDGTGHGHSATSSLDDGSSGSWAYEPERHLPQTDDSIPRELCDTPEYKELVYLKRLKSRKCEALPTAPNRTQHSGLKCSGCGVEPIMGTRWRCLQCANINFCSECCDSQIEIGDHTVQHQLDGISQSRNNEIDDDYTNFVQGDYNYLDPNYMPAT